MKRILSVILLILAVGGLVGCSTGIEPAPNNTLPNNVQSNTTVESVPSVPEQPKEIALTTSNVNDYIIFSVKCDDVVVKSAGYLDYDMANGKATVKTSAKKNVEFSDVRLTLTLTSSSAAWAETQDITIELPFNGISENTYRIASRIESYVSSSPSYTVNVTAVTGTVIMN